jgi:hypothetical protein
VSLTSIEEHFPDFYRSTDQTSLDGQSLYAKLFRLQLISLGVAALSGAFTLTGKSGPDWAGVVAAIAFGAALLLRGSVWRGRPEKDWYAGRAAAESAKTLAWRFVVGADPFPSSMSDDDATDLLLARFSDVRTGLKGVTVLPPQRARGEVTSEMIAARHASLQDRKSLYLTQRVAVQLEWYAKKARANRRTSRVWMTLMLILELCGLAGGVLKAAGVLDVDVLGVVGAIVAAIAAWTEMRQNATLASSYSVAAGELSRIGTRGARSMSESEWADFAANAEEAVSREHTMWAASRDSE